MLKKTLTRLTSLCIAAAATLFVISPMARVQNFFETLGVPFKNIHGLVLFLLLVLAALCWISSRAVSVWINQARLPQSPITQRTWLAMPGWITLFQIAASLFLTIRTTDWVLNGPLDTDETYISSSFSGEVSEALKEINPFLSTRNHGLSTLAAYLSGRFFGLDEMTVRFPAIAFTIFFLVALYLFSNRYLSPWAVVLVYGHLCLNQVSLWYLHSMRGYAPMMAFSLLTLKLVLDGLTTGNPKRSSLILIGGCAGLTVLSHTFGGFFVLSLAVALLSWIGGEGRWGSRQQVQAATRMLVCLVPFVAISAAISASQAVFIKSLGFFNASAAPDLTGELVRFFGIDGRNWLSLLTVLFGGLMWISRHQKTETSVSLLGNLCSFGLVFSIGLALSLQTIALEARMCLAFLVPLVAWTGQRLAKLPFQPSQIMLSLMGLLAILVLPAFGRAELYNRHPEILTGYKTFIENVRRSTAGTAKECLAIQGAPWAVGWTTRLYLVGSTPDLEKTADCANRFLVFFESGYDSNYTLEPTLRSQTQLLISDSEGRHLYRFQGQPRQGEDLS